MYMYINVYFYVVVVFLFETSKFSATNQAHTALQLWGNYWETTLFHNSSSLEMAAVIVFYLLSGSLINIHAC